MSHLRFLEVSETQVTPEGLATLAHLPALDVVSISHKGELTLGDLKPLGNLPALRTLIINGEPLKHAALDYLQQHASKQTHQWRWWDIVQNAYADDVPVLNDGTDVAQLVDKGSSNALHDIGLQRIHDVESDLDHVIPDVAAAKVPIEQDTADNFVGEYAVGVGPANKK